jgi:predicted O-methyltransferase YrrM
MVAEQLTADSAESQRNWIELPVPNLDLGVRAGGNLAEGYQRGVFLQYGQAAQIQTEDLFERADLQAAYRTVVMPDRRKNLYLLLTRYLGKLESQNIVEFGTYRGGTAILMAMVLRELYPHAKVYALDTYEGMPTIDHSVDICTEGMFSSEGLDEIKEHAKNLGLDNIVFVKGLFQDTLPDLIASGLKFGLAHIDADIYSACKYAQNTIWPAMVPGGYLVYDDALDSACIGAMQAVEELILEKGVRSEQVFPHFVFRTHLE